MIVKAIWKYWCSLSSRTWICSFVFLVTFESSKFTFFGLVFHTDRAVIFRCKSFFHQLISKSDGNCVIYFCIFDVALFLQIIVKAVFNQDFMFLIIFLLFIFSCNCILRLDCSINFSVFQEALFMQMFIKTVKYHDILILNLG